MTGSWTTIRCWGRATTPQRFLGDEGMNAMVCDSTNALTPGRSASEASLHRGLHEVVSAAKGRVIVTAFGGGIARRTPAPVTAETGRYMGILGRSLSNMVGAARATQLWHPARDLIAAHELGWLPRSEVLAVATGSQGDPGAALDKLSREVHRDLELEAGDTVVFSSRVIPGNEQLVERITKRLLRLGVHIVTDEDAIIPPPAIRQDELRTMYDGSGRA